jgi:hypothetical protein
LTIGTTCLRGWSTSWRPFRRAPAWSRVPGWRLALVCVAPRAPPSS